MAYTELAWSFPKPGPLTLSPCAWECGVGVQSHSRVTPCGFVLWWESVLRARNEFVAWEGGGRGEKRRREGFRVVKLGTETSLFKAPDSCPCPSSPCLTAGVMWKCVQ